MTRPIAYETAHRVADDLEGPLRRAWQFGLAAVTAQSVRLDALAAAAERRDVAWILGAIPWGEMERRLGARMGSAVQAGLVDAAHAHAADFTVQKRDTRIDTEFTFSFDQTNPRAELAARRLLFDMLVGVSESQREAIRQLVLRLFQSQGETPASIARQIRAHIGLTPRQSAALLNLRTTLLGRVAAGTLDPGRVAVLEDAYRIRLLADRAETIARTEAMRISNTGQQLLWDEAQAAGFLGAGTRRVWLVTPDERLCPICRPIPGRGSVGMGEPFVDGNGNLVQAPPAHPRCRCTLRLEFPA